MFDAERALDHIEYLASDKLGGRSPGTPGSRVAGEYIAARMAEYGLQPAGLDSTYFQTFTESITRVVELPVLAVTSSGGQTLARTYSIPLQQLHSSRDLFGLQNGQRELYVTAV